MPNEIVQLYKKMWRAETSRGGRLLVVCGFDGSGKTTQLKLLGEHLKQQRVPLLETRQPSDWYRSDPWARGYLDNGAKVDPQALALFAAADRRRHTTEVLDPAWQQGKDVLSDRYVYSSLAYFVLRGLDMETTASLNFNVPKPDLAVFLDIPAPTAMERIKQRDGKLKHEEIDPSRISTVRDAYLRIADIDPDFRVLNGEASREDIHAQILQLLSQTPRRAEEVRS